MDCKTAQKMVTPYIKRELEDRELEEFVDHIRDCRECHEELEIYFTIHFALQKLDEEKDVSYNIQKMLKDDLRASERRVQRRKLGRIWSAVLMVLAEAALVVILVTQSQADSQGVQNTLLFEFIYGVPETEAVPDTNTEIGKQTETETAPGKTEVPETEEASRRKAAEDEKKKGKDDKLVNGDENERKNSTD